MEWRFDQGRLEYFEFDEIKRLAQGLLAIDGRPKPALSDDYLRQSLKKFSARPFFPIDYTVWRNYKRVFACALLATEIERNIVCTEICKSLASDKIDADDYFAHFARNFYYPSPIFEGFDPLAVQIFPISAILKLILAKFTKSNKNFVTISEIGSYLIANSVTGLEPITFYETLRPKTYKQDVRQVRELVRFISQFSFLKWESPNLFFDTVDRSAMLEIIEKLAPTPSARPEDAGLALLLMGQNYQSTEMSHYTIERAELVDMEFTEGDRVRVTHVRAERSSKLKEFYFKYTDFPQVCKMCSLDTKSKYPWTERIIEVHHLLPLSSPVRVENKRTSLNDVVGLCPTCHRATHKYYSTWLRSMKRKDFKSYQEAHSVFEEAKDRVC